jgi:Flp pilus assembly pilin Flp
MKPIAQLLLRLLREDHGAETLEYAVVTTLVIMAALGALKSVGTKVLARWQSLNSQL